MDKYWVNYDRYEAGWEKLPNGLIIDVFKHRKDQGLVIKPRITANNARIN